MSDGGSARVDLGEFVSLLSPAVREAAGNARSLEGRVENTPKLHEENAAKQALTVADESTQEILLRALLEHFPGVSLEAEEDTQSVARFPERADHRVIIDPIDGTLYCYLDGLGPYSTILGLTHRGRYEASLVSLPREGLLFCASRGGGAWVEKPGRPPRKARLAADGNRILVTHSMPEAVSENLRRQGFEVMLASGGAVSVAPLIQGVRAGLRHSGSPSGISVRGRVGVLISREAGAIACDASGEPFPDDAETPAPWLLVARDREDIARLRDAITGNDVLTGS